MGQITTTRQARRIRRAYLQGRDEPFDASTVPHSSVLNRAFWRGYDDKLQERFARLFGMEPGWLLQARREFGLRRDH